MFFIATEYIYIYVCIPGICANSCVVFAVTLWASMPVVLMLVHCSVWCQFDGIGLLPVVDRLARRLKRQCTTAQVTNTISMITSNCIIAAALQTKQLKWHSSRWKVLRNSLGKVQSMAYSFMKGGFMLRKFNWAFLRLFLPQQNNQVYHRHSCLTVNQCRHPRRASSCNRWW